MSKPKQKLILIGENKVGKKCSSCGEIKELSEFHRRYKYSFEASCKVCRNNRNKGNKEYNRKHLLQKYDLTVDEYKELHEMQNNRCLICKKEFEQLTVDHNHQTKSVRGLLCQKCNSGLGLFEDCIEFLESAILYLRRTS